MTVITGNKRRFSESGTANMIRNANRMTNSSSELIKLEITIEKIRIWRGIKIFFTRPGFPYILRTDAVVPLEKNLQTTIPIKRYRINSGSVLPRRIPKTTYNINSMRSGFKRDQKNPSTEL
jgi:hypothetical protein